MHQQPASIISSHLVHLQQAYCRDGRVFFVCECFVLFPSLADYKIKGWQTFYILSVLGIYLEQVGTSP